LRAWILRAQPDAAVIIYNDHITSFFRDHYSRFCLGVDDRYGVADEGGGARNLPPIGGHAGLSRHIAQSLVAEEFDLSVFPDRKLDHGCFSPLVALIPQQSGWPLKIVLGPVQHKARGEQVKMPLPWASARV